jgi:hypothetical protein
MGGQSWIEITGAPPPPQSGFLSDLFATQVISLIGYLIWSAL